MYILVPVLLVLVLVLVWLRNFTDIIYFSVANFVWGGTRYQLCVEAFIISPHEGDGALLR